MKTLLLLILLTSGICVRYLRWFAFLQQKEYRLDRLHLFLRSSEGRQELLRLIPQRSDLTRAGCKRPKLTSRIIVVMVLAFLLILSILLGALRIVDFQNPASISAVLSAILILYIGAPAIILIASAPTSVISSIVVRITALKAQRLMMLHKPIVIGITGSYGKSSTKALLSHLLSQNSTVFATPKSYNTLFSIVKSILRGYTNQKFAVIEYAAYVPGEIARITKYIHPNLAIITGFAPQHLGLFGSEDNIISAKAELVAALQPGEKVFSNGSSEETQEIARRGQSSQSVMHTVINWHDLFSDVHITEAGHLSFKYKTQVINTRIIGKQYIQNIALAWTVAALYLDESELVQAVRSFQPTESFITSNAHSSGRIIFDDGGSSNPKGFTEALELLATLPAKQKVVITPGIVDLGSSSDEIHQRLAERLNTVADQVWYVGETGKTTMQSILGTKMKTDQAEILSLLQSKNQSGIVLVEGRMPAWIQNSLQETKE